MEKNNKILSDIVVFNKYAKFLSRENRRETWDEICDRYEEMMSEKYPTLGASIHDNMTKIRDKKVLMSMRAAQFSGPAIVKNESRVYNCAYLPIDDYRSFSEIMFLLLGGTGVGFSVQYHHINNLPEIRKPLKEQKYLVGDSIEGWADAVRHLLSSYFGDRKTKPHFDFTDIRAKGSRLVTAGGKAPGPEPLKRCLFNVELILERKTDGQKLTTIEAHDIVCHIADAVLAGGIRRAALISLFSADDDVMLAAKAGPWWEKNPQRGRANNSAVILRHRVTKKFFSSLWEKIQNSGCGEPGIYFSNDRDYGCNPCCLGGDELLKTTEGNIAISSLADSNFNIINYRGEVKPATAWCTGEKELFEIKAGNTKEPYTVKATGDHRFMLNDGTECEVSNLKGKKIMPFYSHRSDFSSEDIKYGFLIGDGSFRKDQSIHKNIECSFTPTKDDEVKALFGSGNAKVTFTTAVSYGVMEGRGIDTRQRTFNRLLPDNVTAEMLCGLYSANGSVITNHRVALKTTSYRLAIQVLDALYDLGMESAYITTNKSTDVEFANGTYTCRQSYDINISNLKDMISFASKIGFVQTYKRKALEDTIKVKAPFVYSIKSIGIDTVYDFSIDDDTHWGIVNGLVAHNCEIALRPYSFCNLTEVNVGNIESQEDLNRRCQVAAFFGTLQAGYTDFHYLRPIWQATTEKDALIGVGMTGICNGEILKYDLQMAAAYVKDTNIEVAELIGINPAARLTTIKPSGTTSCVVGTSSGIHAWHSKFYIRRMQCTKDEALYKYLSHYHPELVAEYHALPNTAVIEIPQKAVDSAITREDETALDLLERVSKFNREWVAEGHVSGSNTNNVSATVSIKEDEWDEVMEWMWKHKSEFNGLSVLPYDGGVYQQAPFEPIAEADFVRRYDRLTEIDLTKVVESDDNTDLSGELACAGGSCEVVNV